MTAVKKQSWLQLLSIQAAGSLCLPVIMVGQVICQKYGWVAALYSIAAGNVFLLAIGLGFAALSSLRPQTTVQHACHYFGKRGGPLFATLMILSMLGWFAIQLNVMSLSLGQLLAFGGITIPPLFLNITLGAVLSCIMCFGMRAMKTLSNFSAPLLALTLLYSLFSAHGAMPGGASLAISGLGGISLVIGSAIAAAIDLPTFFQHARSRKDALVGALLLYGLIVPCIEAVGVYLAAVTGGHSILEVFQNGHGLLWGIWISCFVLFSGLTTNTANLYSAITASFSLLGKLSVITRTLGLGAIGIVIACFNPLGNMEGVLDMLSVTIGSMGAVILSSYFLELCKRSSGATISSLISWIVGVAVGLSTFFFHYTLTGISAFDAFLAAAITQIALKSIPQRKLSYETIDN